MPGDRYIEMQPDVVLIEPGDDKTLPLLMEHRRLIRMLTRAPVFGENMEMIYSAHEILERLGTLDATATHLRLTEEDWKPLMTACSQKPSMLFQMIPSVLSQLLPMLEAITKASKTEPTKT